MLVGTLLVANVGSGVGAHLGAARLLYGMGSVNALPRASFAAIDRSLVPRYNVLIVGAAVLGGAFLLARPRGYDLGVQLLNFGALTTFFGVNMAAFVRSVAHGHRWRLHALLPPALGALICVILLVRLGVSTEIVGSCWMALGLTLGVWRIAHLRRHFGASV